MPDRYIRDELLGSEAWWGVSADARTLFVAILLTADDAARLSGAPLALRSRLMAGTVDAKRCAEILAELVNADLVRPYTVDGKPYLFVPKFRQRKRYVAGSKHPPPPNEINDMIQKKTDSGQTQDGPKPDPSQTKDGPKSDSSLRAGARGVGVGVGVSISPPTPSPSPDTALDGRKTRVGTRKGNGQQQSRPGWWKTDAGIMAHAVELGIAPLPGETYAALKLRLFALAKRHP